MSRPVVACTLSLGIVGALLVWPSASSAEPLKPKDAKDKDGRTTLVAGAVLPADTFAPGPTAGRQLGTAPINGRTPPFVNQQPIQGFSGVLEDGDGFLALSDNGFGQLENSADFRLRLQRLKPRFET